MTLLRHELYKVFGRKIIWLGLLFFVVLIGFSATGQTSTFIKEYGNINSFYQSMYQGNEGKVSDKLQESADNWFKNNYSAYQLKSVQGRATIQENREFFFNGQINYTQYLINERANQITKLQKSLQTESGGYLFRSDSLQLAMLKGLKAPGLYFTLPLENDLIFPFGLGFCVMGVLVLLGVSPIFSEEYDTNMDSLILSSKKGRKKVVTAKLLSATVYSAFVSLVVPLANFCFQAARLGVKGWNAPVQIVSGFTGSPYPLTVGGVILLQTLVGVIACIFFGMLVLLVSSLSKNIMVPFFSCGCLFALTALLKSTFAGVAPPALAAFADFSYTELMRVTNLIQTFKTYDLFGFPVLYLNLILAVFTVVTATVICFIYRIFPRHQVQ
jgi:hypothetical protein